MAMGTASTMALSRMYFIAALKCFRTCYSRTCGNGIHIYRDRRLPYIFFLGIISGIPLILVNYALIVRLSEAGFSVEKIGLASIILIPYTLKFLWSPVLETDLFGSSRSALGKRQSWLICISAMLAVSIALLGVALTDTSKFFIIITVALIVATLSASFDTLIDTYRIEALPSEKLAAGSAVAVTGYRLGMWVATTGVLFTADAIGWLLSYSLFALVVVLPTIFISLMPEDLSKVECKVTPIIQAKRIMTRCEPRVLLRCIYSQMSRWMYFVLLKPLHDIREEYGTINFLAVLTLLLFFNTGSSLNSQMSAPYFFHVGFNKVDLAWAAQITGVWTALVGGLIGGALFYHYGSRFVLIVSLFVYSSTSLMYIVLYFLGDRLIYLCMTTSIENLSMGFSATCFSAFLSELCNKRHVAVRYSMYLAICQLASTLVYRPLSGYLAEHLGWLLFFSLSFLANGPAIIAAFALRRFTHLKM